MPPKKKEWKPKPPQGGFINIRVWIPANTKMTIHQVFGIDYHTGDVHKLEVHSVEVAK